MEVISAPASTRKFLEDYYISAPTSPSHLSQLFYKDHFDDLLSPKNLIGDDFAFDVSEEWETSSQLSAEELFDGGVIKPQQKNKIFQGAFSPRGKNLINGSIAGNPAPDQTTTHERGRSESRANSSSRRAARSLSPIRDGEYQYQYIWEEEIINKHQIISNTANNNNNNSSMTICSSKGGKKWRLKEYLLLFRSASEGRAAEKDHLKKYTAAYTFRAVDSPRAGQRKGPVSAHELHYTVNRAVSQDLKKKTFLPYKQGILGRLAFNPAVHALANGFGFSRK